MKNLKQRIDTTQTIIDDAITREPDIWIHNIMKNQVVIMDTLLEMREELDKIAKKPGCGCGPR